MRISALSNDVFFLPLVFDVNQEINASSAMQTQLVSLVQRLQDLLTEQLVDSSSVMVLPDPLEIELLVESDAPCQFTISQFAIRYNLARHSFPNGEAKQVLRFTKEQLEQQSLDFEVPSSVHLSTATLRLAGDTTDPTSSDTAVASSGQLSDKLQLVGENGLRLDTEHRWSSSIKLVEAILSGGLDLLVSVLTPAAQLHIVLVADVNGAPDGERLASAEARLLLSQRPQLLRFMFDSPLLLQQGSYWLQLESYEGIAVWHMNAHAGARILPWSDNNRGDKAGKSAVVNDMTGIASWVASDGPMAIAQQFPEITLADQPLPLSLEGNDWVYDLIPVLGASTASGSVLLIKQLSVLANGPKPVTIYAPRIEYEL